MKTESGPSETRERGFVTNPGQGAVSAVRAATSGIAATNAAFASDDETANNRAEACQPAISDNQSSSFLSASRSGQSAILDQAIGSRIPYWLIGILLTATAVAKLWMLLTDPFADVRVSLPREILWFSVAFEFWLAFENFRLRDHRVMAFINTVVFASFAIFASVRLAMGYGSCGCSGNLELPAWIFIALDVGIIVWFTSPVASRTQTFFGFCQLWRSWSFWSPEKRGSMVGLAIFGSFIIGLQLSFAAPLRALVLGESPVKALVRIDGELKLNQESIGRIEIFNRSAQPVKIIGMAKSCQCFEFKSEPYSKLVPANGMVALPLALRPTKVGMQQQRVELFLDHPRQSRLIADFFMYTGE